MSPAVAISRPAAGVLEVRMQDREHKNMFSDALVAGLTNAFAEARADLECRVVVLTGYDNYFCSGGTQDGLISLQEGRAVFTDMNIYALPLECEVPVISAMQGHAIGGGFVFGLFADAVVLGRECVYTANFMKYGFTPGIGSTFVLPRKLGLPLAQEMLLSARSYRGAQLEKRGIPFPVVPRDEVLTQAHELARELADKPRVSLVELKNRMVADLRAQLPGAVAEELRMHETTFRLPEVATRIRNEFGK